MDALQFHWLKIKNLKERLKTEVSYYEKAVQQGAGFAESKRLFQVTRRTEDELKEAIQKYYKMLEREDRKLHDGQNERII